MLNCDPSWVSHKLRILKISKIKGQYELTDEHIEMIKNVPKKHMAAAKIIREYGLTYSIVKNLAFNLGVGIRSEKMLRAVQLYKTREYTTLGIKKRL